jgi:hypothetical protein
MVSLLVSEAWEARSNSGPENPRAHETKEHMHAGFVDPAAVIVSAVDLSLKDEYTANSAAKNKAWQLVV